MTFITNATLTTSGKDIASEGFDLNDNTSWIGNKGEVLDFHFDKTVNIDKIQIKGNGTFNVDIFSYSANAFNLFGQINVKGTKKWETFDVDSFVNITKVRLEGQSDKNEIIDVRFLHGDCNCCKDPCECEECPDPQPPKPEPTPTPQPTPTPEPTPEDLGRVKDWGSKDDNPNNWKVTEMQKTKGKFKVVDKDDVNKADNFNTKEGAELFVKNAIAEYKPEPPTPTPTPGPEPKPEPEPDNKDVDQFGVLKIYPDAASKRFLTNNKVEFKTRHYASDKPDDNSVENTIDTKDKKLRDMESTVVIVNKGFEHHDRFSYKLRGPAHKDNQGWWYIFETSTDGKWTKGSFQIEKPHPKYFEQGDKITPLFNIDQDLRKGKIGIKAIAINKTVDGKEGVHLEQWINLDPITEDGKPKNEGWKKYMEVDDVGQFKNGLMLECEGTLVTMRIDGILSIDEKQKDKVPEFYFTSVREIKNKS